MASVFLERLLSFSAHPLPSLGSALFYLEKKHTLNPDFNHVGEQTECQNYANIWNNDYESTKIVITVIQRNDIRSLQVVCTICILTSIDFYLICNRQYLLTIFHIRIIARNYRNYFELSILEISMIATITRAPKLSRLARSVHYLLVLRLPAISLQWVSVSSVLRLLSILECFPLFLWNKYTSPNYKLTKLRLHAVALIGRVNRKHYWTFLNNVMLCFAQ